MRIPSLLDINDLMIKSVDLRTACGRKALMIAEVDIDMRTIKFLRSTGKISWSMSYDKFVDVYIGVVEGRIPLKHKEIDLHLPTFGNYAVGLMKYFMDGQNELALL